MDRERTIDAGREATGIKSIISPYIHERVDSIVRQLVSRYRNGDLRYDTILGQVAEISALYALLSNLDVQERQGQVAMEKEHGEEETPRHP